MKDKLLYWMEERERVRKLKEVGAPKPWSADPVFQETYFCNVNREDDKVTKWIRNFYSPHVKDRMFLYNIVLSRFLNSIQTLNALGYRHEHDPEFISSLLHFRANAGNKIWGNAYIITTHGIRMPKVHYLVENVLGGVDRQLDALNAAMWDRPTAPTLSGVHTALMRLEGLGSFLAAQVVADLKNTLGHPLQKAPDWWTFVAHGPGSLRGASWVFYDKPDEVTPATFDLHFAKIRAYVDYHGWKELCSQNLQNCLCEFDKYCRVFTGSGRSKRSYNGHN